MLGFGIMKMDTTMTTTSLSMLVTTTSKSMKKKTYLQIHHSHLHRYLHHHHYTFHYYIKRINQTNSPSEETSSNTVPIRFNNSRSSSSSNTPLYIIALINPYSSSFASTPFSFEFPLCYSLIYQNDITTLVASAFFFWISSRASNFFIISSGVAESST